MLKPKVIVTIDKTGDVSVEAANVRGKSCTDLTAGIEKALGVEDARTVKPEYHQRGGETHQRVTR